MFANVHNSCFCFAVWNKTKPKTNMDTPPFYQSALSARANWYEKLARTGLMALGLVYCLIGTLTFMAAFEAGGKTKQDTDQEGVFRFVLAQPFGHLLLGLIALGLACYAFWRLLEALLDPAHQAVTPKRIGRRIGYASSGLFYGSLAFVAASLALGNGSGTGQQDSRQHLAAQLLAQPYGQWLLSLVALGTLLVGAYQIYRALSGKYRKKIETAKIKAEAKNMLIRAGLIGYVARGLVWMLIAYLFWRAAVHANAREAGGTEKAFQVLEHASYGSLLLGSLALGLICYGVFMFVRARAESLPANF